MLSTLKGRSEDKKGRQKETVIVAGNTPLHKLIATIKKVILCLPRLRCFLSAPNITMDNPRATLSPLEALAGQGIAGDESPVETTVRFDGAMGTYPS
jgi:hypothetical protein